MALMLQEVRAEGGYRLTGAKACIRTLDTGHL